MSAIPTFSAATIAKVGIGTIGATAILASAGCDEWLVEVVHVVGGPVVGWSDCCYDYYDDDYDEVWVSAGYYEDDYYYGDFGYYGDCYDPWCKGQESSSGGKNPGRWK